MVDLKAYWCDRKSIAAPTHPATQRFVFYKATATNWAKISFTLLDTKKIKYSFFASKYGACNVFSCHHPVWLREVFSALSVASLSPSTYS